MNTRTLTWQANSPIYHIKTVDDTLLSATL